MTDIKKRLLGMLLAFATVFAVVSGIANTTEAANKISYDLTNGREVYFTVSAKRSFFKKDYTVTVIVEGNGAQAQVYCCQVNGIGADLLGTWINGGHQAVVGSTKTNKAFSQKFKIQRTGGGRSKVTVVVSDGLSISKS
ncbi:MAG: hypothetical protein IJ563_12145 [Selenomonadaceae bacterium]|nr:hypothetical protein [Selenomonadaceae bacterium]MBR1859029.1 hypothetical protein [Selenomonadaceae bacterium]